MSIKDYIKPSRSYHASDRIYGLISVLPLLLVMERHHESSVTAIFIVFFTLVAIWLAESYSRYYVKAYTSKKSPTKKEIQNILRGEYGVVVVSYSILLPFFLELLGVISLSFAYNTAQLIGILLLFAIGYKLASHIEKPFFQRIVFGCVSSSVGLFIVALKILVH